MDQSTPRISLVMATCGRSSELQPLLRSLLEQTERRFELVVVDQNADDRLLPLIEALRQAGVAVQHLRLTRCNASLARNAGAEAARAEWLAFPDDDCWYEAQTLATALRGLQAADGAEGLVGHWVEAAAAAPRLDLASWRCFRGGEASMITLFVRAAALRRWGGFDERIGPGCWYGGGEETDLMLRSLARQGRWTHAPGVRVHHVFGPARWMPPRERLQRSRGTGALYAKHRLPPAVVLRGLLGPWLTPWRRDDRQLPLRHALLMSLGRLQGLLAWWAGRYRAR